MVAFLESLPTRRLTERCFMIQDDSGKKGDSWMDGREKRRRKGTKEEVGHRARVKYIQRERQEGDGAESFCCFLFI